MRKLVPLLAVLAAASPGCGDDDGQASRASAELRPVNGSGVEGTAELELAGEHLSVHIAATGLAPDRIHEQGIHGLVDTSREASCPEARADDEDQDELVEAAEAERAYGERLVSIEPYPTIGEDGRLDYELTIDVDRDEVASLGGRVLVLSGMDVDPPIEDPTHYKPELPVACGRLEPEEG